MRSAPSNSLEFLAEPRRPDSLGRIGHYEVRAILGRGGFGIVFRANDDMLQRAVAVKVLAPQLATTSPAVIAWRSPNASSSTSAASLSGGAATLSSLGPGVGVRLDMSWPMNISTRDPAAARRRVCANVTFGSHGGDIAM